MSYSNELLVGEIDDIKQNLNPMKICNVSDCENPFENQRYDLSRARRLRMFARSVYGEFICTCLLMIPIYGSLANCHIHGWDSSVTAIVAALVSALAITSVIFAFSDMSGAQCNCAISFALWLTGRLSNRKLLLYFFAQFSASIVSEVVIYCTFSNPTSKLFKATSFCVPPNTDIARLFATEFVCTFMLTYTVFSVAFEVPKKTFSEDKKDRSTRQSQVDAEEGLTIYETTPISKSGFAPFAIGFSVFVLCMFGGTCGISLNPARMLGPAIFSGCWDYIYVYWLAEFAGAGLAAVMVTRIHPYGLT